MDPGFEHGVELEDPHRLLAGKGTRTHHLDLVPAKPIPAEEIGDYLEQALSR